MFKLIKQEDRKRKGLTEYEKHIIDRLVDENISIRAIGRILGFNYTTILKYVRKKL